MTPTANDPQKVENGRPFRIEWQQRDHSDAGRVGDVPLFTVGYQSKGRYYVRTSLPGFKRDITRPTMEEAKVLCESMLDRFLQRIGASWADGGAEEVKPSDPKEERRAD